MGSWKKQGMAWLTWHPALVGLSRPRVRRGHAQSEAKPGPLMMNGFSGLQHACADRVKCTCLTRAPAAVGVLMAFGLSDVLRAMVYLPCARKRIRTASHRYANGNLFQNLRTVCMWC